MYTAEEFDEMPPGTVLRTHHGSQWTKKGSGVWNVDSDPLWGPHLSSELPPYAEVVDP